MAGFYEAIREFSTLARRRDAAPLMPFEEHRYQSLLAFFERDHGDEEPPDAEPVAAAPAEESIEAAPEAPAEDETPQAEAEETPAEWPLQADEAPSVETAAPPAEPDVVIDVDVTEDVELFAAPPADEPEALAAAATEEPSETAETEDVQEAAPAAEDESAIEAAPAEDELPALEASAAVDVDLTPAEPEAETEEAQPEASAQIETLLAETQDELATASEALAKSAAAFGATDAALAASLLPADEPPAAADDELDAALGEPLDVPDAVEAAEEEATVEAAEEPAPVEVAAEEPAPVEAANEDVATDAAPEPAAPELSPELIVAALDATEPEPEPQPESEAARIDTEVDVVVDEPETPADETGDTDELTPAALAAAEALAHESPETIVSVAALLPPEPPAAPEPQPAAETEAPDWNAAADAELAGAEPELIPEEPASEGADWLAPPDAEPEAAAPEAAESAPELQADAAPVVEEAAAELLLTPIAEEPAADAAPEPEASPEPAVEAVAEATEPLPEPVHALTDDEVIRFANGAYEESTPEGYVERELLVPAEPEPVAAAEADWSESAPEWSDDAAAAQDWTDAAPAPSWADTKAQWEAAAEPPTDAQPDWSDPLDLPPSEAPSSEPIIATASEFLAEAAAHNPWQTSGEAPPAWDAAPGPDWGDAAHEPADWSAAPANAWAQSSAPAATPSWTQPAAPVPPQPAAPSWAQAAPPAWAQPAQPSWAAPQPPAAWTPPAAPVAPQPPPPAWAAPAAPSAWDAPPADAAWSIEEAPPAPLVIEGMHRIVVHTLEGNVKRGVVHDLDLSADRVVLANAPGAAPSEVVSFARTKALFFLLSHGEKPPVVEGGRRVRVTFVDGRRVEGLLGEEVGQGFFLLPLDGRTNTARMYVLSHAVRSVE